MIQADAVQIISGPEILVQNYWEIRNLTALHLLDAVFRYLSIKKQA